MVAARDAFTMTDSQFPNTRNHNDCGDAFRHAYWNASMTIRIGAYYAELFASAHESDTPADRVREREMDLFNNSVGRTIGLNNPNAWYLNLADIIKNQYLYSGKLRMFSCANCGNDSSLIPTSGC
jgi:hypothetical protein